MSLIDAVALGERLEAAFPNRKWYNRCEAFRFQATRITNDLETMEAFSSAFSALENSTILDGFSSDALPGDVGWWDKTQYLQNFLSLGNDVWVGATGLGDTILEIAPGVKVFHGYTFPAEFLGFATHVGDNPKALLLPYQEPTPEALPATGFPVAIKHPLSGDNWSFAPPSPEVQLRIQLALSKRGLYQGKVNGIFGNLSIIAIQDVVAAVAPRGWANRYNPGKPDYDLCFYIQAYASAFGGFVGTTTSGSAVEGILGPNAWEAFARALEVSA